MSYHFITAKEYALQIYEELKPYCVSYDGVNSNGEAVKFYKLKIAGSLCRKMPVINDFDIVCQWSNFNKFAEVLYRKYGVEKLKRETRKKDFIYQGIKVEMWIPQPDDYYRILTIRQGSGEWVRRHIATGWKKIGWVGTSEGLRLRHQCKETIVGSKGKEKSIWHCIVDNPTLPPVWKDQEEFFKWLDIPYTPPELRL